MTDTENQETEYFFQKRWFRRFAWGVFIRAMPLVLLFVYRYEVLDMAGRSLIWVDEDQPVEVVYLFSGSPRERAIRAAELYKGGFTCKIICTGEIVPHLLVTMDIDCTEGELSEIELHKLGVPGSAIRLLPVGTSTYEEIHAILSDVRQNGYKNVGLVSSRFHSLRIGWLVGQFRKENDPDFLIFGSYPLTFYEHLWYKSEDGLLFVTNEYIKLVYYRLKYS